MAYFLGGYVSFREAKDLRIARSQEKKVLRNLAVDPLRDAQDEDAPIRLFQGGPLLLQWL